MSEQKYISEIHNDHKIWLSVLALSKDEIKSFRNRLSEVDAMNSGNEIKALVEQFQNQFIREIEVIDELVHDIHKHEQEISDALAVNAVAADHRKVADHPELRDRMSSFSKIFNDLKSGFVAFVAKTL